MACCEIFEEKNSRYCQRERLWGPAPLDLEYYQPPVLVWYRHLNHSILSWQRKSLPNHVQNKHTGHDNQLFQSCAHPQLLVREARKNWIKPSPQVATKLENVVLSMSFLTDMKISSGRQTSVVGGGGGLPQLHSPVCSKVYGFFLPSYEM